MAYRRSRTNIRRPVRRRRVIRRAAVRRRPLVARRRRTYRQRAAAAQCACPKQLSPGDKFVLVQSDPFDTKFFGSKVPDSSTLPSISTPVQYNVALSSSTNAGDNPSLCHAWAFYPSVSTALINAQGLTASGWSWTAAGVSSSDAPMRSSFVSQFEAYRPTAHAIRLSCPFAPTSTTGFVHIAIATETIYNSLGVGAQFNKLATNLADMSGYTFYKRVTLASLTQSPITLINKWTDESAFRYQSPYPSEAQETAGNGLTFHIPYNWGTLLVAVEGASTVTTAGQVITPLQAEVVLHTEAVPDKASTLIGSTAAAYSSGMMSAVSHAVANTDFAHTEDQQENTISQYMSEVAAATGEHVSNFIGGQVSSGLAYAERQGRDLLFNQIPRALLSGVVNYARRRYGGGVPRSGAQNIVGSNRLAAIMN